MSEPLDFLGFRTQWRRKRGTSKWYVYTLIADRPIRSLEDKIRALTRRTSQQPPRAALIRLNQIMRGWASYFKHAVCKHPLGSPENFAWHRVIRWWKRLHRWKGKDVRHNLTGPHGRWRRPSADGIELFNRAKVPVTRYRYRGSKIPSPRVTPNGRDRGEPVDGRPARRVRRAAWETDRKQSRHRAPGRLNQDAPAARPPPWSAMPATARRPGRPRSAPPGSAPRSGSPAAAPTDALRSAAW
jgi:hypothetical protein